MTNNSETIAIVGGHFAPGYTCALAALDAGKRVLFFGRKHAFSDKKDVSLEYRMLSENQHIKWHNIESGRGLKNSVDMVLGVIQSLIAFGKTRPSYVLSFGSYLSIPVCTAAWLLHIPVVIHEQTIIPGTANRILARFAKKIFITFPETEKFFPQKKVVHTGIPIYHEEQKPDAPLWLSTSKKPLLLVLGGSSGSHSVNIRIEEIIDKLSPQFRVVHQTGDNIYHDFGRLRARESHDYTVREFITPSELDYLMDHVGILVTRSGANTFFLVLQKLTPCVLIPLPWSAHGEQKALAEILSKAGVGYIYNQEQQNTLYSIIVKAYEQRLRLIHKYDTLNTYKKLMVSGRTIIEQAGI
ncbi:MAG: glycosyltransferase [Patescibacteria group bacterium]|jgi:UDP-N-acetylglucosamine--N-acetylmuramyl-(pentapeptide) pyrophosphoryl-undecaprenol N-acetylglucosamine transferase